MISFMVYGRPAPKGSKRAWKDKRTGDVRMREESTKHQKPWMREVKRIAQRNVEGPPLPGPISVMLTFYLKQPKTTPVVRKGWPMATPDLDKLVRAVLDALTGIVFKDDAQVCEARIRKTYTNGPPGCYVQVGALGCPGHDPNKRGKCRRCGANMEIF